VIIDWLAFARRSERGIHRRRLSVIEGIERFQPQLNVPAFREVDVQSHALGEKSKAITILLDRPIKPTAARQSDAAQNRCQEKS
jgi:hypothetical protein